MPEMETGGGAHLASAARELERLLGGIYPQQKFIVEVDPPEGDGSKAQASTTAVTG